MPAAEVDVVVRTKDRPLFLRRALRSIGSQTFERWRVILVNDGGDAELVRETVAEVGLADRVTIVDHETSRGRWPSANAGIERADAPLVILHDDDDSWHPEFLQRATDYLTARPDTVGVVSRQEIIWERVEGSTIVETGREVFQEQLTAPLLGDTMLFNRFVPIGFLYRRELHEILGPYREDLAVVGDWEFNLRILTRWPLEFLDDAPYVYWHQRPGATGADGNSVIAEDRHHRHYDAMVRDARLRAHVQEAGQGDLLYLTKFVDSRIEQAERVLTGRLDRLEATLVREQRRFRPLVMLAWWVKRRFARG